MPQVFFMGGHAQPLHTLLYFQLACLFRVLSILTIGWKGKVETIFSSPYGFAQRCFSDPH